MIDDTTVIEEMIEAHVDELRTDVRGIAKMLRLLLTGHPLADDPEAVALWAAELARIEFAAEMA